MQPAEIENSKAPLILRRGDGGTLCLDGSRCAIMAVLNLTPDSFSDGGCYTDSARALDRATELIAQGADILDIGAESTRPGAQPLTAAEEWQRLAPVILPLAASGPKCVLSIDTRHAETARRAQAAGFRLLNLPFPQDLCNAAVSSDVLFLLQGYDGIVLMHSRGDPATMRDFTDYGDDLCQTVVDELVQTVASLWTSRVSPMQSKPSTCNVLSSWTLPSRLIFDPGLGFAKTAEQSTKLLANLGWFRRALGGKLLIGASRKSMLGAITGLSTSERLIPSVTAAALAAYQGADIVRVHDVPQTVAALRVAEALRHAKEAGQ